MKKTTITDNKAQSRAPVLMPPLMGDTREPAFADDTAHIVDELIQERCPRLASHWSWFVTRPLLYSLFSYKKARHMADTLKTMGGQASFDYLVVELSSWLTLDRVEQVPPKGPLIVVANHPTGLADGVVVWQALRRIRKDIVFFANGDALRVNPAFSQIMIPVEWVMDKRTPGKTRATLKAAREAIAAEKCLVIFPSGKLAKKIRGMLTEQVWMPSAVSLARKYGVPIQPLNIRAANSWLYYACSSLNDELRDIMLFHELLNKKNKAFTMTFGPLIDPDQLVGSTAQLTLALRDYIAVQVGRDPNLRFTPIPASKT